MKAVALVVLVACGSTAREHGVTQVGTSTATETCSAAAAGLEHATRDVRAPDSSILAEMRQRCGDDHWPDAARDCFAKMDQGDLGRCARTLPDEPRNHMFAVLRGAQDDRAQLVIVRARLQTLEVGVGTCNEFVTAVTSALSCEQLPLDKRVQLGNETADFWDLPTHGLPEDAQKRMTAACGTSLAELQQAAQDAGCML